MLSRNDWGKRSDRRPWDDGVGPEQTLSFRIRACGPPGLSNQRAANSGVGLPERRSSQEPSGRPPTHAWHAQAPQRDFGSKDSCDLEAKQSISDNTFKS
jgi:hypothetical protein